MKLNREREYVERTVRIPHYETYPGSNIDALPKVLADTRVPLSTAMHMERRLDVRNDSDDELRASVIDYFWDTSDLIAYDDKKRSNNVKIVLTVDNQNRITKEGLTAFELINPREKIQYGAIVLGEKYDALQGSGVIELPIAEIKTGPFTKNILLESKLLRILARHLDEVPQEFAKDKNLLKEYSHWLFTEYKQRFAQQKDISYLQLMEIFLDEQSDYAKMRAWDIGGLEHRSNVDGRSYLGSLNGRFVGFLAPEAPQIETSEAGVHKKF